MCLAAAQTCSSTWKHSEPRTQPPNRLLIIHFSTGSSGSLWCWSTKWASSFPLGPLASVTSWFSPPTLTIIPVTTGRRGPSCCSDKICPFLGGFEANGQSTDWPKAKPGSVSNPDWEHSFIFYLAIRNNSQDGISGLFSFCYISNETTQELSPLPFLNSSGIFYL